MSGDKECIAGAVQEGSAIMSKGECGSLFGNPPKGKG